MELTIPAYAKLNWSLQVLGAFPEDHVNFGYTEIESLMLLLDLHDLVTVKILDTKNSEVSIHCDNPNVPQTLNGKVQENVCFKAIQALKGDAAIFLPKNGSVPFLENDIEIYIEKNIPLAGGLGGSSTDGVAVLKALDQIYQLNLSRESLIEIAATFGSDTPFFASGYPQAIVKGRGEIVEPCELFSEQKRFILVNPGIELYVGEVFKALKNADFKKCGLKRELYQPSNDLQHSPYVSQYFKNCEDICQALIASGCEVAQMSGSGSTCFGLCSETVDIGLLSDLSVKCTVFEASLCSGELSTEA
ncbi:MAG: 4-(cytidine 5'-diphospho)-2-C-methyl-D-erythritol kinase [Deltaproteobacteria bacterium]|nr:4-(cytidine 5'-diphospho)-2-C-methyl-D-erythritol kinase [Deltaproteobacteria bacterium]